MSIEVHQFLNDASGNFTETAPRPPVPGEENELQSNGGTSTRSSGSHKSHISGKSFSSGKSGSSHRADPTQSPAGTPRRSNLDKGVGSLSCPQQGLHSEDLNAPLGFEPEGSAASSPPFTENGTPAYLKWAENLNNLLDDGDGVKLFKSFLDQEHCSSVLDFWFACQGLKMADKTKVQNLIKVIYRKYVRDQLNLKPEIKKKIAEKMNRKEGIPVDQSIFDEAQAEVERTMRNDSYPQFLKSDIYVQYVKNGGESPKTSRSSSGSNSVRPAIGPLPTLREDEELKCEDILFTKPDMPGPTIALTKSALQATSVSRAQMSTRKLESPSNWYLHSGVRAVNPYHVPYAPVSTQDTTEVQSLSSDPLTDDTMSLTDSSVDGAPTYGTKKWKKHVKRNMQMNVDTSLNQPLIPRTDRAPKDRNIAETDPPKFAEMLIKKLEKVLEDQQRTQKLKELFAEEEEASKSHLSLSYMSSSYHTRPTPLNSTTSLPLDQALLQEEKDRNESAQSILEEHCSRVWDNSAEDTPSRSPGRHSPSRGKSPERYRRMPLSSGNLPMFTKPHHKRKEKEYSSTHSFDSGISDERVVHEEGRHRHIHHHHHHHHISKESKSKSQLEKEVQRMYYVDPQSRTYDALNISGTREDFSRGRSRDSSRRTSGHNKKGSDSSSVIDSGVSLPYDRTPTSVPNIHDPNNEKVLNWMLGNDHISQGATTHSSGGENSDRTSSTRKEARDHSRRSHSTITPPVRGSGSKKQSFNGSRSGSLDRSLGTKGGIGGIGDLSYLSAPQVLPSQPIVQDPSMPLLTPPNPTTQLEEAKRRLEDESRRTLKSRSFTSTNTKDKRSAPGPLQSMSFAAPTRPLQPKTEEQKKLPKSSRPSSSAPTTPSSSASSTGEATVVGYYFCGEPIPYRSTLPGRNPTLAQFKQLITKRGNYRYFFKKASDEFDSGVVHMEVTEDNAVLPLWEGKVVGKVEKVE